VHLAATLLKSTKDIPGSLIITPSRGLVPPETTVNLTELTDIVGHRIVAHNPQYRDPLERDLRTLSEAICQQFQVVFLGSIARRKCIPLLRQILSERLVVPRAFIGMGICNEAFYSCAAPESGVRRNGAEAHGYSRGYRSSSAALFVSHCSPTQSGSTGAWKTACDSGGRTSGAAESLFRSDQALTGAVHTFHQGFGDHLIFLPDFYSRKIRTAGLVQYLFGRAPFFDFKQLTVFVLESIFGWCFSTS
jgi:hypothetical protein